MMFVILELMIAIIWSIEQVLVCRILLYSPPQLGYGTSCDECCSGSDGISMLSSISLGGKITVLNQVTKQQLDSQFLLFWFDGFSGMGKRYSVYQLLMVIAIVSLISNCTSSVGW